MDDHDGNTSNAGAVTLYELAAGNADALLSDDFFGNSGLDWRDGQVVQVDTAKARATGRAGAWVIDPAAEILSFSINLSGTNLLADIAGIGGSNELAMQWAMSCGNDVVAGALLADIPGEELPEPSVLVLLLSGLGGLVWIRRRQDSRLPV
jgi:hypothetical protein